MSVLPFFYLIITDSIDAVEGGQVDFGTLHPTPSTPSHFSPAQ